MKIAVEWERERIPVPVLVPCHLLSRNGSNMKDTSPSEFDRSERSGRGGVRTAVLGGLRLVGVFGLAVLVAGLAGLMAYGQVYGERIMLGVTVHDVDVGGLGRVDAERVIGSHLGEYEDSPIALRLGDREWKLAPAQLGVRFEGEKAIDRALQSGKQGNSLEKVMAQLETLDSGVNIDLTFAVDADKYSAAVKRLAAQIDQAMVNAAITIDSGQVRLVPPREEITVDQVRLREQLEQRVQAFSSAPIEIPVLRSAPKVTAQDLEPARARAQQMISGPVKVMLDDMLLEAWTVSEAKLVNMVVFEEKESGGVRQMTATLSKEALRDIADQIAAEVKQTPVNARFDWDDGRLKPIANGRTGRALDVDRFVDQFESVAVAVGERKIALPMRVVPPVIGPNDGLKMGIQGMVEERRTDYSGGAEERRYNVRLGASRVHGVVVSPGEIFSFSEEVGEITEENGYRLGFAIIGADTVPDPGGGICQVSTTMFQSIFWAGYEIVERNPHAYRIRRYEQPLVGIDAAIYPPSLDLRFRNNSGSYLLIQTRTDDKWLYVTLYGTKPTWTVSVDGPHISNIVKADTRVIRQYTPKMEKGREVWVETAEDGLDVTVNRTVQRGSEIISRDRIFTRFRPERNVILIGTGGEPPPSDEISPR